MHSNIFSFLAWGSSDCKDLDPSIQTQILVDCPLPRPEREFNAKLIWFFCLTRCDFILVLFLFLFTCTSAPLKLHYQPVLLLQMRTAVWTHCERLCPTAQPPIQRMLWPLCNCDLVSSPCRSSLNTSWLPLMMLHVFLLTVAWIMQGCSPSLALCSFLVCFQRDSLSQEQHWCDLFCKWHQLGCKI